MSASETGQGVCWCSLVGEGDSRRAPLPVDGGKDDESRRRRGGAVVARRGSKTRSTEKGLCVLVGAPSVVQRFWGSGELLETQASPTVATGGLGVAGAAGQASFTGRRRKIFRSTSGGVS